LRAAGAGTQVRRHPAPLDAPGEPPRRAAQLTPCPTDNTRPTDKTRPARWAPQPALELHATQLAILRRGLELLRTVSRQPHTGAGADDGTDHDEQRLRFAYVFIFFRSHYLPPPQPRFDPARVADHWCSLTPLCWHNHCLPSDQTAQHNTNHQGGRLCYSTCSLNPVEVLRRRAYAAAHTATQ
jgi:hypothetical protein